MGINTNSKSIVSLLRLRTLLRFCFRIRILKHIGKKIFFMQGQWNTGFCLLLLLLLTWRHSLTLNRRTDTEISEADILLSCCCYLLLFVLGFFECFFVLFWFWPGEVGRDFWRPGDSASAEAGSTGLCPVGCWREESGMFNFAEINI